MAGVIGMSEGHRRASDSVGRASWPEGHEPATVGSASVPTGHKLGHFQKENGGSDGARTRDLRRDRPTL